MAAKNASTPSRGSNGTFSHRKFTLWRHQENLPFPAEGSSPSCIINGPSCPDCKAALSLCRDCRNWGLWMISCNSSFVLSEASGRWGNKALAISWSLKMDRIASGVSTLPSSKELVLSVPCGTRISDSMLRRSWSWLLDSWLLSFSGRVSALCCSSVSERLEPRRLDGAEAITFWLGGPSPPIGDVFGMVPLPKDNGINAFEAFNGQIIQLHSPQSSSSLQKLKELLLIYTKICWSGWIKPVVRPCFSRTQTNLVLRSTN